MEIDGKQFEVNHPDKIFYPGENYTKSDVMGYYQKIAPYMLPHLKNRPFTMLRFPDGIDGKKFFQKDEPDYFPEWIKTKTVEKQDGGKTKYVICNNVATLAYLASQACLTPHCWLSQTKNLGKPDKLIFDLDPSDDDFSKVKFAAKAIKSFFLKKMGTSTFVMTTGSRGLHVVIPLKAQLDFDAVRNLAQKTAKKLETENAAKLTTATRKSKRGNKIYLDVARNGFAQTAVAPYSLRPYKNAPLATPLDWNELDKLESPQQYSLSTIFNRLGQKSNTWAGFYDNPVSPKSLLKKLENLE